MHPSKNFHLLLICMAIFLGLGIFAILLWPNRGPALAQDGTSGEETHPGSPAASQGDGPGEASLPLIPSSSGGDGLPQGTFPALPQILEAGPDGATSPQVAFSYYRLLGTAFNVRSSTTTFAYNFNGCVYETGGTDNRFMAPLLLPEGATIKFLRLYFDDTSAGSDLTAWLTRYQPGVTSEDLTSVTSSGSAGYGTALSAEITHTVDLDGWAYTVIIAPNGNATTNTFCGVRVAYYAPPFGAVALPMVIKNGP